MKILTTFTYDYLNMFQDIFLPSLPEDSELIIQYHNYELEDCKGKFSSHDTLYKIPFILKVLEECKENEKILYLDVDIVILDKKIEEHIKKLDNVDINIQWDNPQGGVCLGCMLLKNTKNTRNIFKKFLEVDYKWIEEHYGVSLRYFQYLLETEKIRYKQLPMEFFGGQMLNNHISEPENIYLYHATFEKSVEDKYNILKSYYRTIYRRKRLKFSILLMYYNRPKLVRNALESIKRLKYNNWELCIIDDGSEVNIEHMAKNIYQLGNKVKYYRIEDTEQDKKDRGGSIHGKYMNLAIEESDADIFIPLCDDDALMEDYLNNLERYFETHPDVNYAYSNLFTFDPYTESPFDIKTRRTAFGDFKDLPIKPKGLADSSQIVFRKKCFDDGLKYPYPMTKNLDSVVFGQLYEKYGECPFTGFSGQYKAGHKNQLGTRKSVYNYKD